MRPVTGRGRKGEPASAIASADGETIPAGIADSNPGSQIRGSDAPPDTPPAAQPTAGKADDEITLCIDFTDEEKVIIDLLNEQSPAVLNELKGKAGLSNKKWDIALKGLRAKELVTVEKDDEGLTVRLA